MIPSRKNNPYSWYSGTNDPTLTKTICIKIALAVFEFCIANKRRKRTQLAVQLIRYYLNYSEGCRERGTTPYPLSNSSNRRHATSFDACWTCRRISFFI
ncbi:hypothetical protein CEXT_815091 [Caerostris extrusa]|uniref:Uncharacterized protein n=1 Tax=Caerostris extrusa TaxID=172846 RepID=A0AAV4R5H4_CAEEX|nr:hypothetical protein CEXT_815091 [Caerostris extrusa]